MRAFRQENSPLFEHEHLLVLLLKAHAFERALNPFPAKAFVPLVKIAFKNNLSEKFLLARSVGFENVTPVWKAWKVGIEARGHTTSYIYAGTTLRRTPSDVIMAVNGLIMSDEALID